MNIQKLTEMDDFFRCVDLMKKDGRGDITPIDVFRVDTIGSIYEELDRGYVIGAEDRGELTGFCRLTATLEPNVHWVHELFGSDVDKLILAAKGEGSKKGATEFVWLQNDEWLRELNEYFGISQNTDPDRETLIHLNLRNMEIKKEEKSLNELKPKIWSEDPLITNVTSYEELDQCVKIQNDVGWGDVSAPARVLKPEMLSEHFSVICGILWVLKREDKVVAFARVSASFKKGVFYGHEGALLPLFQSIGVGKSVVGLVGDYVKAIMKDPKALNIGDALKAFIKDQGALEILERAIKKSGSIYNVKIIGTIDPLNAKMLGLATTKLISLFGGYSRGVHIAKNLYGVWDTEAHGSAYTDRVIWAANLQKKKLELGAYPVIHTEDELEGLDYNKFYFEFPDIDMDMSDTESKNKATRMLAKAINEYGYTLTHVSAKGTTRYLLEKS